MVDNGGVGVGIGEEKEILGGTHGETKSTGNRSGAEERAVGMAR